MTEGIIYILTNPAMPDYIKIGFTNREDIKARLKELYSTGVPFPFELYYAIKVTNAKDIESLLHDAFLIYRKNPNREFFEMDVERAVSVLKRFMKLLDGQEVSIKDEEIYEQETIEDIKKSRKQLSPIFKFSNINISPGTELTFFRDKNIKCTVVSDTKVQYEGEEYSITSLVRKLTGKENKFSAPNYWLYNGKTLKELRRELELEQESE